jgi:hypothetical protein
MASLHHDEPALFNGILQSTLPARLLTIPVAGWFQISGASNLRRALWPVSSVG